MKSNNYEINSQYYKNLKLKRTIYINKIEITEENFSEYFYGDAIVDWGEITKEFEVNPETIKNGIYKDLIPTVSGFGHKETRYVLSREIKGLYDEEGNQIREGSNEIETVTANTSGVVRIKIEGKEDEREIGFTSGKFVNGEDGVNLAVEGAIRIAIMIDDEDYKPYETELNQKITKSSSIVSMRKEGFNQKGTSGKSKYNEYKERYAKGTWISYEGMEFLSYNSEICLYLRVKEGYGKNKTLRESGLIYLKAEALDLGGFTLNVCKESDYNAKGMTANPHQNVELEISGETIGNISWDFGDNTKGEGQKVEYRWGQKADWMGDTSEYELKINCENNEVTIPVHIVDTKAGFLYGDEVWWGNHRILGRLKVEQGQILTIGKMSGNEGMEILCNADEEEKYMGCLEIKGELKIANGTSRVYMTAGINTPTGMEKESESEGKNYLYWKGIEVEDGGKAIISGVEISGGQRGIAIDRDGKADVNKSILRRNGIGVHVLREIDAKEITVTDNTEYGIKEEGCSLNVRNSIIKDNTLDWYSIEEGVLNKNEIYEQIEE